MSLTIAVPPATTLDRDALSPAALCAGVDALVVGPGLGATNATRELVEALCEARGDTPLVLDADALNVLAPWPASRRLAHAVLTPHPGEAARLLWRSAAPTGPEREAAALELSTRSGAVVVLKGAGTLVTDGTRVACNTSGNPGAGTGGTGDVLAGLLAALLALGITCCAAAGGAGPVPGLAGDRVASRLSEPGLCADDLPLAIAEVLREHIAIQ